MAGTLIDPRAVVDSGARVGENVTIGQYCRVHYDEALSDWVQILVPDSYRIYYKRRVIAG